MIYPLLRYKDIFIKILLPGLFVIMFMSHAKGQDLNYRAQSLYIYKFTKFVYWPDEKKSGDFTIGVFGNSPILEELRMMASIKKAGNEQTITVKEVGAEEDLTQYHIIYITSSKSRQIRTLKELIGNLPVLLVAEREGMASKGATISFMVTDYDILKFEVNVQQLENQKMTISEDLIKLGFKL